MSTTVHPGRSLYSILKYWRAAGLQQLALPELQEPSVSPEELEQKRKDALNLAQKTCAQCELCDLHQNRKVSVWGQGPLNPKIMFIGSSPSDLEEQSSTPFQGEEGELLERMFSKMEFQRQQLYLCYATACRPPNDRAPTWEELKTCRPHLIAQIEHIRPTVIVTLGTVATQGLLQRQVPISKLRGQWQELNTQLGTIPVMPTFHPGFLLKKPAARKDVWSDMVGVLDVLKARK